MNQVKNHYDQHLGSFYSWMIGDFEVKMKDQKDFFLRNQISPKSNDIALDLGCGNGLQSVALAQLGFNVIAYDFNKTLLHELRLKKIVNISLVESDLLDFDTYLQSKAELIVCMGDTLTHLNSLSDVASLVLKIKQRLTASGKTVFSFRDLSSPIYNEQRFIPVRSDDTKIHTCFLEYFDDHVQVYDLLHEYKNGQWMQAISSYPKLKLTTALLKNYLNKVDLSIVHEEVMNRMIYLIIENK